jgi:hypothetical protein
MKSILCPYGLCLDLIAENWNEIKMSDRLILVFESFDDYKAMKTHCKKVFDPRYFSNYIDFGDLIITRGGIENMDKLFSEYPNAKQIESLVSDSSNKYNTTTIKIPSRLGTFLNLYIEGVNSTQKRSKLVDLKQRDVNYKQYFFHK